MNTTTTAPKTIADLIADEYTPLWVGPSGESVTGESVARHVEAASELLAKDGWARSHTAALTEEPEAPAATLPEVQQMLADTAAAAREYGPADVDQDDCAAA